MATTIGLLLASAPLTTLFTGAWFPVVALSVIAVCGTGGLLRALPVPLVAVTLTQTAAFLCALTLFLTRDLDLAALLALRDLVSEGVAEARTSVAPLAATPQTLAMLAVLVFLGALMVETLTVGLGLAGFSGLLVLVMAAVPFGIRPGGSPLLVAPALGWVLMLAADQAVRLRPVRTLRPERSGHGWLAAVGLAGAAVACSAILATALAPTSQSPWLRNWWSDVNPMGDGGAALDPLVSVRGQLRGQSQQTMLWYSTSDGEPAYLQVVTLELFDGTDWSAYAPNPGLSLDRPRGGGGRTFDVAVMELGNPYLPVPQDAVSVSLAEPAEWGWDLRTGDAVSTAEVASGLRYRVTASADSPDPVTLATASSDSPQVSPNSRALPSSLPPEIAELAAEVTAGAQTNYAKALALQHWFVSGGGFRYSLDVPDPAGRDPLQAFLTDRVGFCQQYSSAMAVMARTLGIPARVVVGFDGGSPDPAGGFAVRGSDAHAWPQLWFDEVGWVRFEPTPAAVSAAVPNAPSGAPATPPPAPSSSPTASPGSQADPEAVTQERGPLDGSAGGGLPAPWLALAGMLAVALFAPASLRRARRKARLGRIRSTGDPIAAWQEIRDSAVDAGIDWPQQRTARQQADAVAAACSAVAAEALARIVGTVEHHRYATPGTPMPAWPSAVVAGEPSPSTASMTEDVQAVLKAVDAVPRKPWWRVVPRSLMIRDGR